MNQAQRFRVLGVQVDALTMEDLYLRIQERQVK